MVLLIMGITIGFALLAFGDFGSQRRIVMAAEQFINYVKFVQQQASLETSTLGINVNRNTYQVLRFHPPTSWQRMPQKGVFHEQHFPSNAIIRLESDRKNSVNPQIIINASGEMTAFTLNFSSTNQSNIANVVGEYDGTVSLQVLKSP